MLRRKEEKRESTLSQAAQVRLQQVTLAKASRTPTGDLIPLSLSLSFWSRHSDPSLVSPVARLSPVKGTRAAPPDTRVPTSESE